MNRPPRAFPAFREKMLYKGRFEDALSMHVLKVSTRDTKRTYVVCNKTWLMMVKVSIVYIPTRDPISSCLD